MPPTPPVPSPEFIVHRVDSATGLQTYLNSLPSGTQIISILLSQSTEGGSSTGWDFIVVSR